MPPRAREPGGDTPRGDWPVLIGAAFLMATSAIGPGFLTQTAVFTTQLGASFGFAIVVSIGVDLVAQLNIWRIVVGQGRPAQVLANELIPGLGHLLSVLVAIGGLAFNIGNVAGAGLGLNALFGLETRIGAALSAALAIAIFLSKEAGRAMDRFAQALGILMVVLAGYVAVAAHPPILEAVTRTVFPVQLSGLAIITIVGGTVGGYITFAGAHRLIDAGLAGPEGAARATRSAVLGIGVASLMRIVLFLGALGVVSAGLAIDPANPSASVFRHAAGEFGLRIFGLVMWAASITSVVGSAFTSVSFIRTLRVEWVARTREWIVGFIAASTLIFLLVGRPVTVLLLVGALNGLILPLGLGAMLAVAAKRKALEGPLAQSLAGFGVLVTLLMAGLGVYTLMTQIPQLLR